jgi:hypothetical protein
VFAKNPAKSNCRPVLSHHHPLASCVYRPLSSKSALSGPLLAFIVHSPGISIQADHFSANPMAKYIF